MTQTNTSENKLDIVHLMQKNYVQNCIHSIQSEGFRKTVETRLCESAIKGGGDTMKHLDRLPLKGTCLAFISF